MKLLQKYPSLFEKYGINTTLRIAHFLGQIHHESNLKPISENLNYSASGLLTVFPKYFTKETATLYARQPERIANRVYASRMGNGDEKSGDGFKFRGRGFIQITGKDNYTRLSKFTGIDFVTNPDLLLQEPNALLSALWFWNINKLNTLADRDDIRAITRIINGGLNGFNDRVNKVNYYKGVLK